MEKTIEVARLLRIIGAKEVECDLLREQVQVLSAEVAKKNEKEKQEDGGKG